MHVSPALERLNSKREKLYGLISRGKVEGGGGSYNLMYFLFSIHIDGPTTRVLTCISAVYSTHVNQYSNSHSPE